MVSSAENNNIMKKIKKLWAKARTLIKEEIDIDSGVTLKEPADLPSGQQAGYPRNIMQRFTAGILTKVDQQVYRDAIKSRDALGGGTHILDILDAQAILPHQMAHEIITSVFKNEIEQGIFGISTTESDFKVDIDGNIVWGDEKVEVHTIPPRKAPANGFKIILVPRDIALSLRLKVESFKDDMAAGKDREKDVEAVELKFTFKTIVEEALSRNASDIHITFTNTSRESDDYFHVFLRIDGLLIPTKHYLMDKKTGFAFFQKTKYEAAQYTKGEFSADNHFVNQDARIVYDDLGVDIRLAFLTDGTMSGKNALVARLLVQQELTADFDFKTLGYGEDIIEVFEEMIHMRKGLGLISGVTGSGKSTALSHAIAKFPDTHRVFTIENPIEYKIKGAAKTQHQIWVPREGKNKADYDDYTMALKRADPDVVYLTEIRNDPALVKSLVEMSNSGIPVVSSAHYSSAFEVYSALTTIFNVGERDAVGLTRISINQVLVKRLCPHCKIKDTGKENQKAIRHLLKHGKFVYSHLESLQEFAESGGETYIHNPDGCPHCRVSGTPGYVGRVPIYEYFTSSTELMSWYTQQPSPPLGHEVEAKVYELGLGKNKLDRYVTLLHEGVVDASTMVTDELK